MNPRVSRSSALASKATGFPIAKIAAKLAVGLHARRDPQRHHQGHAGQLRADDRLRRHQGARAGPSRSSPARRACWARRCSRWGRRWRSAAPSPSRSRRRCDRSSTAGSAWPAIPARRPSTTSTTRSSCAGPPSARPTDPSSSRPRSAGASASRCWPSARRSTRGSSTSCSPSWRSAPRSPRSASRGWTAAPGAGPSAWASPTPSWAGCGPSPRPTCGRRGWRLAFGSRSRPSTRARPSSRPRRRTTTPPTRTRTRSRTPVGTRC